MDPGGQDSWELELELRPTGALAATGDPNELVATYERQLSAAQLVQQRLQHQYDQLVEEKASVEASLGVQIAALQQQLASVHAKAADACTEAERAQQQVQSARAAVEQIVHAVTQLAEHLDEAGATPELTLSFEAVAKSTQATYEAVSVALSTSEVVVELGCEAEKACMMDPILTSTGGALGGLPEVAGALRGLQDDARRLTSELQASREREQQLDQELQAAQILFTGLEAEVVGLQHEQAQAAAKLQLSHEELLHGRSQLLAAKRWLLEAEADGPAVDALSLGIAKLDAHMAAVREFLEGLSMPVPPPHDEAASAPLQDNERMSAAESVSSGQAERGSGTQAAARARAASGGGAPANGAAPGNGIAAATAALEELTAVKAERDDARQQLDMLAANISLLERRLEEVQVEKEQLEHQLGELSQLVHAGSDAGAGRLSRTTTQDGSLPDKQAARSRSQAGATGMEAADGQSAASRRAPNTPGSPARRASRIPAPPSGASLSPGLAPPSDRVSESGSSTRIPKPSPSRRADGSKGGFALDQSTLSESVLSDVLDPLPSASLAQREHQQRVEQLSATVAALEQQVGELQSACKASTERASVLQEEKEAAATLLQKLGDEQRLLAEQLRVLEVAKDNLEAERSQLVTERERLRAQLTAALEEAETCTEGHGEEQEELRADYAQLAATLAEVRARTDTMEGERDRLQADRAELAAALADVKAHAEGLEEERDQLQADCAELAAALAGVKAHAKGLEGERDQLQADCAELAAALADVKAHAEGLDGEREQLQAEAAELADRARELRQENSALRGKVEALTQRISSLEAEREELMQQHEEAVSVAAAAGAAGAAAAVAVSRSAAPAPEGESSYGDGGPGSDAATAAAAAAAAMSFEGSAEAAALRQRVADLESEVEHLEAAREAAAHRQAQLESELTAMGELLQQATDGQETALRQASSYVATAQRAAQLESEVEALNELLQQTCTKRDEAMQRAEQLEVEKATADEQHALDRKALEEELQAAKASSAAAASALAAALPQAAVRGSLDGIPRGLLGQAASPLLSGRGHLSAHNSRGHLSAHNSLRLRSARASSGHMVDSDEHAYLQVDSPLLPLMYNNLAAPSKMHTLEPLDPMDDLVLAAHRVSATAEDAAGAGAGSLWRSSSGRPLQLPGVEGADPGTLSSRVSLVQPARQSDTAEEVAQLQAALCSLLVSKALATAQLQAEHEAELSMLQAAHEAELSRLQVEGSAALAPAARVSSRSLQVETAAGSAAGTQEAEHAVTELQAQVAELEATVVELQALQEQLQEEHAAELVRASDDCDARLRQVQAAWEGRLLEALEQVQSQLDEARARDAELQVEAASLRSQLEAAQGRSAELQARVEELQGLLDQQAQLQAVEAQLQEERARAAQLGSDAEQLRSQIAEAQANAAELQGLLDQQEQLQAVEAQLQGERARAAQLEADAEQLRLQLADAQARGAELQSQAGDLQQQLAQVQSDKEVEEQSLQSLLATKAWMTQEIRSLQSDLREAQQKLERTEAELAAAQAAAAAASTPSPRGLPSKAANAKGKGDGAASSRGAPAVSGAPPKVPADKGELSRLTSMMRRASIAAAPGPGAGSRRATRASVDGGDGGSPTVKIQTGAGADSGMAVLSDQLAEAAMQAALAEAKLEQLQLQQQQQSQQPGPAASAQAAASPGGPAASLTAGMGMEHTDMMMETLVLHGEIDELKAKQGTLQEQLGVMGEELAKAVLQASLAEALLEQARVRRPGRRPSAAAAAPRQGAAGIGCLLPQPETPLLQQLLPSIGSMARFQRSPSVSPQLPSRLSAPARPAAAAAASPAAPADARPAVAAASTPTAPLPEYPGTKAVSPLEQTQQLKSELQVVARALNELFEGESPTGSRQTLSTLRPAVLTAIKITDHVTSSLQQQQQQQQQGRPAPHASTAAASRGNGGASQPAELDRVRAAYRDAREVYDMLRSDAEDLNRRLWRWGSNLREQVTAMEQEVTRVATASWPGQEAAVREVLAHKDQYLRDAEVQIAQLQGDLRSAQKRVLRRNQQLANLQHVLVQLSEQVSMFEGVVVRCEVLSADLASQAVKAAA